MKFLEKAKSPVTDNRHFSDARVMACCVRLRELIYAKRAGMQRTRFKYGFFKSVEEAKRDPSPWMDYAMGTLFGHADCHAFFLMDAAVPADFAPGSAYFTLHSGSVTIHSAPQMFEGQIIYKDGKTHGTDVPVHSLLYLNGRIIQGMDANHEDAALPELSPGGEAELGLAVYIPREGAESYLHAALEERDQAVNDLFFDLFVPLEAARAVGEDTRDEICRALERAVDLVDFSEPYSESFYEGLAAARRCLREEFYEKLCRPGRYTAAVTGHTHIDVAWKWQTSQTREKVVRSFSTVLRMMEQYPEYRFMSSQAELYVYLREEAPQLYDEVKRRVREGRWEVEGAMWLEPDTNLPSGESLVRQLLYGKRFFKEEFGAECRTLWLPDVFGYSAALPQILKLAGVDSFSTSKLGWNQYNLFPYTTFYWQGIDGSRVLTQLITTQAHNDNSARTGYNGELQPSCAIGSMKRHTQRDLNPVTIFPFGYGDGGGGPNPEAMEHYRRMEKGIPGVPATRFMKVSEYFDALAERVKGAPVPTWEGELYFECHRGTYSSISDMKRFNREGEKLCAGLELLASILHTRGEAYPSETLHSMWRTLMLHQFHDVLPGSSIKEVYEDAARSFAPFFAQGEALKAAYLAKLLPAGAQAGYLIFNTLSFARGGVVRLPGVLPAVEVGGRVYPTQLTEEDGKPVSLACIEDIPSMGYVFARPAPAASAAENRLSITAERVENDFYTICFDACGQIISLYDKQAAREVITPGGVGNAVTAYQDLPGRHDNWNIDIFYRKNGTPMTEDCSVRVEERGPVRACLAVERRYSRSTLRQRIYFYAHTARIDFVSEVDWHNVNRILKVNFPVDVYADGLTCDIQFGNVKRPVHKNTSWELAKFEVPAHKWVDLSESDYGVALLSDAKYGFGLNGRELDMTILKSGTFPDTRGDEGVHAFTYALYPHTGDWRRAGVDRAALELNEPAVVLPFSAAADQAYAFSAFSVSVPGVFVDAVKKSEDGESLILRVHENRGARERVTVSTALPLGRVAECDLMEQPYGQPQAFDKAFSFVIKPYEIKSFRIDPV